MANNDASSSTTSTVRVLVSFYLAASDNSSSARTSPIHKEKFNVPVNGDEHKYFFNFVRHLKTFTGLSEIAKSKGLGENPEITIARVQKAGSGALSPTFAIKPEVCLTIQVENVHAVSHFKHPTCTLLEYARDFGNNMKESLKRATKWSAYYFTRANSYYPVPETKVPLRDIPKIKRLPVREMSKQEQDYMRQWAIEHGKAVRQLSVRQNNTKHAAGTLPLNMYRKELPVGDRVTEEPSSADDIGDQLSEYDSDSSNEEESATHEDDAVEAVPVNFLSKTMRTRTGRQITLSYRALSSY